MTKPRIIHHDAARKKIRRIIAPVPPFSGGDESTTAIPFHQKPTLANLQPPTKKPRLPPGSLLWTHILPPHPPQNTLLLYQPPIMPWIRGFWIRIVLVLLACASWIFTWLGLSLYKGDCSLCLYFQETTSSTVRALVLTAAVCIFVWTVKQWPVREVIRLRQIPMWVKASAVQPFFTVSCIFLGEHANDLFSAFIGAAWIVFAVSICLLSGYLDDFGLMENIANVTIQAIFVIHHKNFWAYAIIFAFTSVLLVIKQAITIYYFRPALPLAAPHLPTHGVAPTANAMVVRVQP